MRYIGSIIFVAIIALFVFGAIEFKDSSLYHIYKTKSTNLIQYIKQWIDVKKHNMRVTYHLPTPKEKWMVNKESVSDAQWQINEDEYIPGRTPPLTLLVVKTKLENFFPERFVKELDQDDWDYIFDLIYEPIEEKQGDFMVKRYLTQKEIEQELIYQYKFPFSYFKDQHWNYFWQIVYRRDN